MKTRTIVVVLALFALLVVGSALAMQESAVVEDEPVVAMDYIEAGTMRGCENYCSWCVPHNGDGACNDAASCC